MDTSPDMDRMIDTTSTITCRSDSLAPSTEAVECDDGISSSLRTFDGGRDTVLRQRLRHVLDGYKFQLTIVFLVILDCLLVIAELLLDIRIMELEQEEQQLQSLRDDNQDSRPYRATTVVHVLSLSIVSLFLVEIVVKLYAFRLDFFRRRLELFDAAVILATFTLDVVFRNCHDAVNGSGLLIILRLWRVARILNGLSRFTRVRETGVLMSVKVQAERRMRRERESLEDELLKYRQYCCEQEHEIDALRLQLRKYENKSSDIVRMNDAIVDH